MDYRVIERYYGPDIRAWPDNDLSTSLPGAASDLSDALPAHVPTTGKRVPTT